MQIRNNRYPASTLPELLVTMIVGGILLLAIFDGVDMIRESVEPIELLNFGEKLSKLQGQELLEDRPDTVSIETINEHVQDE